MAQQAALVATVAGPVNANGGGNFTYNITVINNGPDSADGSVLSNTAPAGSSNLSATCTGAVGGAVCPSSFTPGNPITATIPTLPNGGQITITVQGNFPVTGSSSLTNTTTITSPPGSTNPNPSAATSSVSTAMSYVTDLVVTKTETPTTYPTGTGGTAITYTVTYTNNGPAAADGASIWDQISFGMLFYDWSKPFSSIAWQFVGCTPANGAVCPSPAAFNNGSASGTSFTAPYLWSTTIPTLPAGGSIVVVYTVTLTEGPNTTCSTTVGGQTGVFHNEASISVPVGVTDSNFTNNSINITLAPTPAPPSCPQTDLVVTKTETPTTYPTGAGGTAITYTVTYTNNGPAAADGASIWDQISFGMVFYDWSKPFDSISWQFVGCTSANGAVCPSPAAFNNGSASGTSFTAPYLWSTTIPTLPAGGSIAVVYTVTLTEGPNTTCSTTVGGQTGVFHNVASISVPNGVVETNQNNNSIDVILAPTPAPPVCPQTDLVATAAVSSSTVTMGSPLTYTLTYTNSGSSAADGAPISAQISPPSTGNSLIRILAPLNISGVACTASGGAVCPAVTSASFSPGISANMNTTVPTFPAGGAVVIVVTVTPSPMANPNCGSIGTSGGTLDAFVNVAVPTGVVDSNISNNSQTISSSFTCADISANKTVSPTTANRGSPVSYTITLSNAGPQDAANIAFSDPLSPATGFVYSSVNCSNAGGGTCGALSYNAGTNTVSGTIPLIPVGKSVLITISGTGGVVAGTYPNQACAHATGNGYFDPNNTSDCSLVNFNISNTSSPVTITKVITGGPPGGLPSAKTFTGTLTCGVQPVRQWSVTVPAGASSASSTPVSMYDGDTCTVAEDTPPAAPNGYNWNGTTISQNPTVALGPTTPLTVTVTNALTAIPTPAILITKTADTGVALTPGGNVTYTVTVTNNGTGAADGTIVQDNFPSGIASASWTCADSGGAVCPNAASTGTLTPPTILLNETIATLPVGGAVEYTITATAATSGLPAIVANTATANPPGGICTDGTPLPCTATVANPSAPVVSIAKTSSLNEALAPGDNVTYTITVTNSGTVAASGTVVQDSFPTGIVSASWTCAASGGAACPNAASTGTLTPPDILLDETIATLQAGGVVTYAITATAAAANDLPATVANTATANPPGGVCADGTALPCAATVVNPSTPVIRITKTANTAAALTPGGTVIYTVTVTNTGAVAANTVTVQDALPTGIASATWTCMGSGAVCPTPSGSGALNETVATLPAGSAVTYTITATAVTNGLPTMVANTATANSPGSVCADGTPLPCAATVTNPSTPIVRITKAANTATALSPGDTIIYTVTVSNEGGVAASNTVVQDALPAGIASATWTCADSGGAACPIASGNGALNETVTVLPVGGVVTYTIAATAAASNLPAAIVNTATANPPGGVCADGTPLPCAATVTNASAPVIAIVKTVNTATALKPSSSVVYTITVTNTGAVAAGGTKIQDSFPVGIASASWTCASSGGAICPNAASTGTLMPPDVLLDETVATFPVNGAVVYTITATTEASGLPSTVTNTAAAIPPSGGVCSDGTASPCISAVSNASAPVVKITKTADIATALMPGSTVIYTVTVTNTGSVAAGNTVVSDPLPAGIATMAWMCTGNSGAVCPSGAGSGALNETILTLPAGGVVTYTVTATVATAGLPATIVNSATATPPNGACDDGATLPCTATASNGLVPLASLTVTKTISGAPADYSGSFQLSVDCALAGVPVPASSIAPAAMQTVIAGSGSSGQVVFANIPQGAICSVSEGALAAAPGGYVWGTPTLVQPAVIAASGNAASVINVMTQMNPPPATTSIPTLSTVALVLLGMMLLLSGAEARSRSLTRMRREPSK